jgi:hypothetical protein
MVPTCFANEQIGGTGVQSLRIADDDGSSDGCGTHDGMIAGAD